MATVCLPQGVPGVRHAGGFEQRREPAEREQGVPAQGSVGFSIDGQRVVIVAEHLETDCQAAVTPETGPQRRPLPISFRKETQQQLTLQRGRQKAMLGIFQSDERAIGLIPQAGLAMRVKELDFFTRFLQRCRPFPIRPAAEKTRPRLCALRLRGGTENMAESTADERMCVDDGALLTRATPNALEQAQVDQLLNL